MRLLTIVLICFLGTTSGANPTAAETSPRGTLATQLQSVHATILDHRVNLKTSEKNLETIATETETLKRLETEHAQLRADVQDQIKSAARKEKGKAKDSFLYKAEKLDADVQRQLTEIRSRFAPLETERVSWNDRKAKYEAALADLTKKEAALSERLYAPAPPSAADDSTPKAESEAKP